MEYNEKAHLEYLEFIANNPGCTRGDIARHFGRNVKTAKRGAERLYNHGLVRRRKRRVSKLLQRYEYRYYPRKED